MKNIIFTIGRASNSSLDDLVEAGGNIARLTFSYGSNDTQLRRAKALRKSAIALNSPLEIAGELQGQGLRVGQISAIETDGVLPIRSGSQVEFRDCPSVNVSSGGQFVPVPGISCVGIKIGNKLVYGDHKCIFEVVSIDNNRIMAIAQSSDEIASTRSVLISGAMAPQMELDDKNSSQLDFILQNNEFDIVILPNVADLEIIHAVRRRSIDAGRSLKIACRVGTFQSRNFLNEATSICDYLILDRSDLALACGVYEVPNIVRNMLPSDLSKRSKVLITSQVAQSASRGSTGLLSAAEISDAWGILEQGLGGFMLGEETAVDGNGVSAVRQLSSLVSVFMSKN